MKRRLLTTTLWLLMLLSLFVTASAATIQKEISVTGVEITDSAYVGGMNRSWTLSCSGADSISITFDSQTALEKNYDYLYILDGSGEEVGKYTGTQLAGQTITVDGDSVTLRMTTDASVSKWGFRVTKACGNFSEDSSSGGDGGSSDTGFAGGLGTESSPYLIATKAQLNNVRNDLDACYKLTADIVFTDADFASGGAFYNGGTGWTPIGETGGKFTGTFDGNGHTITGLKVNLAEPAEGAGLFGYTSEAVIQRLGMIDGEISNSGSSYWKLAYAGSVAGRADDTEISECYNTGTVSASTDAGGILGFGSGFTVVNDCYNTGEVSATENDGTAGGIAGYADSYCRIQTCYNTGSVGAVAYAGGIAGEARTAFYVTNCYYRNTAGVGIATGSSDSPVQCTINQLHQQATFEGFDFSGVWTMEGNADYDCPELRSVDHVGEEDAFSNNSNFAGGLGTESAPYLIETKAQLNLVRNYLSSHFRLTEDITFTDADFASGGTFYNSGRGWEAMGTANTPFTGSFDGDGYTITGLYQQCSASTAYGGLFGVLQNATVKNLGMVDAEIVATVSSYGNSSYAGSIAGKATDSVIAACYHTGSVKATVRASQTRTYAGGVVGYADGCTILNCYNRGTVISGASSSSGIDYNTYAGGIAGSITDGTAVTNCYHAGTATGSPGAIFSYSYVGGIAGESSNASIRCSYSAGTLNAYKGNSGSAYKGGITGNKANSSTDSSCYYLDTVASGVGKGTDTAVSCTAAEMRQQATFSGFNFRSNWTMGGSGGYAMPTLREKNLLSHAVSLHPACGAECDHSSTHDTLEPTLWTGGEIADGDYYLGCDLLMEDTWVIEDDICLCLNGYTITFAESQGLIVQDGASLELCDCEGTGGIVRGERVSSGDSSILNNHGLMTIYGGIYCPDGEGVGLYNDATMEIYGGSFGIPVDNSGTMVIHDVNIDLPEPDYTPRPSAIVNSKGASLTIHDGFFRSHGATLYNKGTARINGGTFRGVGKDRLNYYHCIDNSGTLYVYGGDISSTYYDGIRNDVAYTYTSSGTTEHVGTLHVYGGTISAPAENRAAIRSRTTVNIRGGTISGYIGIDNDSRWANSTQDGGIVNVYDGTITGTYCGILNGGGTSVQYTNGVVSGYKHSRGKLRIEGSPEIDKIILEYPDALTFLYNGTEIIDLEIDMDYFATGDTVWEYDYSRMPKMHLLNEGYVLQYYSYDGVVINPNTCGMNGDNLRWRLTPDGVLTIFGTGDMRNFTDYTNQPWCYSKTMVYVKKVIVEDGVTSIGDCTCARMTKLTEIQLPESLTQMGNWIFEYSDYQGAVALPSGLQTIGRNLFNGCSTASEEITFDGCIHQWEAVSLNVQSPWWEPAVLSNENVDDGNPATELRCSVCGGVDIAGIDSIAVTTQPAKLDYLEGSDLDVTGGKVTVSYSDDTSEEIDLTAEMVSGYDALAPGTQTLTVNHHGITTTFTVTVNAKSLVSVAVNTPPAKLTYIRGEEELDLTGGMLTLIYNNETTAEIPLTAEMVSTLDHSQAGTQSVAVFYENLFAFFDVMLIDRTGISITVLPHRLTYLEGVPFDLSGSELTVSFSDSSSITMPLEHAMLSYDVTAIGRVDVTVSYKGFTDSFAVTITAKSAESIGVVPPARTTYLEGKDSFDPAGGKVIIYYNNDTEEEIDLTEAMVSGFDNTVVGEQTLTVTCGGFTATFPVTIQARRVEIRILSVEDDNVQISLEENQAGIVYAAVYDRHGKMLAAGCTAVTADAGEVTVALPVLDVEDVQETRVFFVDGHHMPLCDYAAQ